MIAYHHGKKYRVAFKSNYEVKKPRILKRSTVGYSGPRRKNRALVPCIYCNLVLHPKLINTWFTQWRSLTFYLNVQIFFADRNA